MQRKRRTRAGRAVMMAVSISAPAADVNYCNDPAVNQAWAGLLAATAGGSAGYACGAKRYYRQMTSCDEARFYLIQCGARSLDGAGDGVTSGPAP